MLFHFICISILVLVTLHDVSAVKTCNVLDFGAVVSIFGQSADSIRLPNADLYHDTKRRITKPTLAQL